MSLQGKYGAAESLGLDELDDFNCILSQMSEVELFSLPQHAIFKRATPAPPSTAANTGQYCSKVHWQVHQFGC